MNAEAKLFKNNRRVLNAPGMRVTNQRALILEIIRQGRGHLDADEVFRQARQKHPRLSLSTVYRALQKFKDLGLVEEVHFDESHHHYEMKSSAEHHHLVCLGCGRVVEFKYPFARLIKRDVDEARNFEITGGEVRIEGYCPSCQKSRK